jgi:hypothetical protein
MRFFKPFGTLTATLVLSAAAFAQTPRIIYPQEGQDVRGEVTMRFEGIPSGGYAIVKIDGQFKQATAQSFVVFDTLSDRVTFPRGDGRYKVDVTVLSSGGGQVGTTSVNFNVANSIVDSTGEAVRLVHWNRQDRIDAQVQRYRVFAESNASIEGGMQGGGGSGAVAGGGGEGGSESYLPAPLDYQVAALMRRIVRDVFVRDDTANISTIVQDSFERGREGGESGAGANTAESARPSRRKKAPSAPTKGPWLPLWTKSAETGKSFTKRIQQNGQEINATRKSTNVAIADLLPTFPDATVHPGSTWETKMSILGDLTSRLPINVQAPITFTAYDTIQTPNGESRRCAKLESRFRLPDNLAKRIAVNLGNKAGTAGGGGGGGEGAEGLMVEDIDVARTNVARVLWFDMDRRQVLRSEDIIRSYFEIPPANEGGAATTAPAAGGEGATPAEPTKISYNLTVTTWLDDRIPSPNEGYTGGLGTAHAVDNVTEPGLARVRGGR